jgi:hypothetical protein
MNPIVLFRKGLQEEGEFESCSRYFPVIELRTECPADSTVIARYSCLPYYRELEKDLDRLGGKLVNPYREHSWIANFDYYYAFEGHTPRTWFDHDFYKCDHDGSFVVKGKTNSRKHNWNEMMFAPTKQDAMRIASLLLQDGLICEQGVIYREYMPLKTFAIGIGGVPFANEWRFFFYKTQLLSYGYYWSPAEKLDHQIDPEGIEFAMAMANIAAEYVTFFVLDIAELDQGGWVLIEVNDGQMSGLSENKPDVLYSNLKKAISST